MAQAITHIEFSGLMQASNAMTLLHFSASTTGPVTDGVFGLVIPEDTTFAVIYYNRHSFDFTVDRAFFADGTMNVGELDTGFPKYTLRADDTYP